MRIAIKIANVALVLVTVMAVLMTLLLIYFKTFGKNKLPTSITSTYATTVYDPVTDRDLPVLEANYYANKNNHGYEVIEFRINSYSGLSKSAVYARGFQMTWDTNGKIIPYVNPTTGESSDVFYYDSFNNASFETGHTYGWGDKMYIDLDGDTYAVAMDGTYQTSTTGFDLGKSTGNFFKAFFTDWGMFSQDSNWNTTTYYDHKYTYVDLLLKIRQIIKSSSNGTGDGVLSLIDLGDFLHIYELDEHGNAKPDPIGYNGLINSYFTMSTHYDQRGMVWTKQSLFQSVAGDSEFNLTGITDEVEYWQATTTYNLTEQNFVPRYSTADNGFYYVLPTELINELKNYDQIEINVVFNLDNLNVNVLGFDYYALNGITVKQLTISSTTEREFRLMVGSLKDTGLTAESITTINVKLINTNSGVVL